MCGLVGIAGNLVYSHELFMKRLLLLDYFRGTDSTGLAAIRQDKSTELSKAAVNPITLFDMKSFDKALDGYQSSAFIGHNRAATLGKVNDVNAHPYQFEDITGAHNGTLDKESWERLEMESGVPTNTDSAAVFACINAIGIDETIKLMSKGRTHTTGAWALVWYDKTKNTLNFLKNEHRPLWFAFNKELDELYWASEWPMLSSAAQMTKNQDWGDWYYDDDGFTFFPFENDHLYSIELEKLAGGLSFKDLDSFKGRKIKGKEPDPLVKARADEFFYMGGTSRKETKTNTSNNSCNKKDDLGDDIIDFVEHRNFQVTTQERDPNDPLNGFITEERFNEIAKYGCTYCGADVDIGDTGYTIYEADNCILCPDCSKNGDSDNVKLYLPPAIKEK